ncbi:amino acid adenylation domain-containing protein [Krasilnikovia cinnamomea]|uniref:Phenyloxazoline synthase MbtB n=1 Tax=Krasilnikovia cinnamomea TaxID=349313 RepID=A0A4Q7ZQF7_9ACTN|nr:non-ribosomal peptide synthetase [Krasilnikovia cinnamomea]RZU53337.1 amino acid adenylation domain-containing protein [Krasilnikovia cinnamomea]
MIDDLPRLVEAGIVPPADADRLAALYGKSSTAQQWQAALEPVLRAVYHKAYGYADAWAVAHASGVSYASDNDFTEAETVEFARTYAALSTDANLAAFTAANTTANARLLADAYATGDPDALAATYPQALRNAYAAALGLRTVAASPAQQRLWFLARLDGTASAAYHMPLVYRLNGLLDRDALSRAVDHLVARHAALRTRFTERDGVLLQHIDPPATGVLTVHDLEPGILERTASDPFDLETGPLLRARLIVVGPDEHLLALTLHHIVADGWSLAVLRRELGALYRGETLPRLPVTSAGRTVAVEHEAYWRKVLDGAPTLLDLPTDRPRPAEQDYTGGMIELTLDAELTASLSALAAETGTTLFMTVLTGWLVVLSRLAGQSDVVVGTPVANRPTTEDETAVGLYANTVALRVGVDGEISVRDLLHRVRDSVLGALEHQHVPFERVVELISPPRSPAYPPIVQSMVAWENVTGTSLDLPGLTVTAQQPPWAMAKFDLTLGLLERDGRVFGELEYAAALFDEATVRRYAGHLQHVLGQLSTADRPVRDLRLLTGAERRQLLDDGNRESIAVPKDLLLHQLFEAHAARDPHAVAVVDGTERLTYGELNRRANRLAHHLRGLGAGVDSIVGVCLDRSALAVTTVLAVLKAGAAYLPLDPDHPPQRLADMLADSTPVAVLSTGGRIPGCLDLDAFTWAEGPDTDLAPAGTQRSLAYVIYTSGTTGKPNGVLVEHRGILAVAAAWERVLDLRPGLVHLQLAGFAFDVFTADVVRSLGFGGTLVLCPRETMADPAALHATIREHGVGLLDIVPAVLLPLLDHLEDTGGDLTGLTTILCGSDVWSAADAARLRRLCGPDVRVINAYGVTEAAVDSAYHLVPADPSSVRRLPIGRPLPNTRIYLLDERGEPVPAGVLGELHIGGAGVARGYLNRPELTAERFRNSPFVARDRLYRTGDLARRLPDGQLEFAGRRDHQVKVRGLRIELGEIETRIAAHPDVRDAVVTVNGGNLFGYYRAGQDVPELSRWLADALPAHLVPAVLVRVITWPLTPNGKVDRRALPVPGLPDPLGYAAPDGPLEIALAALWAELLGVERVGRHDDFFALGGHSLLALRLAAKVRATLGHEFPPAVLFAAPTLAALAARLAPQGTAEPLTPITPIRRTGPVPVSLAQRRLWLLTQLDGAAEAYHMPLVLEMRGWLDRPALGRALDALAERHDTLRTRFVVRAGEPLQDLGPAPELTVTDLTGRSDAEQRLAELVDAAVTDPFDLVAGPPARWRLVVLAPDQCVLLVTLHHIVADGWSFGVLLRELGALYAGQTLAPLPVRYADFAAWQQEWITSEAARRQEQFWLRALHGAPALLELPLDHPRPAEQDFRGATVPVELDAELTTALRALAADTGATLFMVLLAGWALVLSRLSGQADVVVGTPTANRRRAELDGLIGFFVNTLALRIDLTGPYTGADLVRLVRDATLAALDHQDLPFEHVVELVNPPRSLAHTPLFQAMFAWQHTADAPVAMPGVEVLDRPAPWSAAKFDLALSLQEDDGRITGALEYATALFTAGTAQRWAGYLRAALAGLAAGPDRPLSAVALLDAAERERLVTGWNRPVPPPLRGIRDRFADQVRRAPGAAAVTFEQQTLSYEELDARAGRLAARLVRHGAGPDRLVGLCLRRSPELIVAVVAALKAGAAYVPLDPDHPVGRLAGLVRDCRPVALLAEKATDAVMTEVTAALDDPPAVLAVGDELGDAPIAGRAPVDDNLAYVLYTSGTTGTPKGVAQTWRAMDNLIDWQLRQATPENPVPARVLQFASIGFDVSFQEIWTTLCAGGTLVLLDDAHRKDLGELRDLIAEQRIERAFLPAAVLHHLANLAAAEPATAAAGRCEIVTAGEALRVNDDLRRLLTRLGGAYLHNQYGPTETHVATQHTLAVADAANWPALPPIGRPLAATRVYLLDQHLEPVPVGVVGEIYIAGAGLARGYLNRPGPTAAVFRPDPFGPPGSRMYASGDLARRRADGVIDYVGRADTQVKVRGFRVELGEVEHALLQAPGVREAAVLRHEDEHGDAYLTGYLAGTATVEQARDSLRRALPEHLVPTRWVRLDRLPLTANGKVDRRALPAPDSGGDDERYVAARTEHEARMAGIWAEVLRRDRVGVHDDFFALGGHSLLATRLLHIVEQRLGARLSLRTLFQQPVLADFAAAAAEATGRVDAPPPIAADPAGRFAPFPLTDIQQAYWVGRSGTIELGGVGAHGYTEIRFGEFDPDRFEEAVNRLIDRHDMLRAVFHPDGTQQVQPAVPRYRPARTDLRGLDAQTAEAGLAAVRDRMAAQVFDAEKWPLFEFAVTILDGQTRLHMSLDALVVDAASTRLLEHELTVFYRDPAAELPPIGLTFRDYVLAERTHRDGPRYRRALTYWRERAADLALAPDLPLVRQPETIEAPRFTRFDEVFPAPQWSRLKDLAGQHSVTPSALLLTAFAQVLARWSRHPRFTLSLPLFNRLPLHPDVNAVIGDFTSLVLVEVTLDPAASFAEAARAVQLRMWHDIDHSAVSGVRVNRLIAEARGTPQAAMPIVFNSTLADVGDGTALDLADGLGGRVVHGITQTPQVWLDHTVAEVGGRLLTNWDSVIELFPDGLIGTMFDAYRGLLGTLADPAAWQYTVDRLLPVAAPLARPVLPADLADRPLLHELFDRQALASPDADAVLAADRRLSYAALRTEARNLAGRLQAQGVAPGDLVAVLTERGWRQVVATLAVLYAGGAYLPLDPDWPQERRDRLVAESGACLVLGPDLDVSPGGPALVPVSVTATDLAYVIYTSGSTGRPKGVQIDHRGAVNTILDVNERFGVGPTDRVLALSALSFDLSVWDIFGTLGAGAAVVTLEPDLARDPAHWLDRLHTHRVSVWNSVPALLGLLVEYAEAGHPLPASLRLAMLSGDWIPVPLPDRVRALRPGIAVHSLGGATEASIWSIHHPVGAVDPAARSIPYGTAMAGQSFHVLDDALAPRPVWAAGQLYIGGIGLAQGYRGDDARTAAAFITHPVTGERLYRTGDLGRLLPDGAIEFLGREDDQVKVQGYRIELGEIEVALRAHPAVRAAAVKLYGAAQEAKRLAGYVVTDGSVMAGQLREHLAGLLPGYMVPATITFLDALPLSANAKVDRSRLPEPAAPAPDVSDPQDPVVARISRIVAGILGRDAVPVHDNLLLLGATSIDMVRIANALDQDLKFRPNLARFMRGPTVAELFAMYQQDAANTRIAATARQGAKVVDDPAQRAALKARAAGRRHVEESLPAITLGTADGTDDRYARFRSTRQFDPAPIAPAMLAGLLDSLVRRDVDGAPKFLYASAGGAYPVQTYLYVKPGRVDGVPAGAYYHDPDGHRLVALGTGRELSADAYDYFVNRPVYEQAAFALFLIAELDAIEPLYGEAAAGFCRIEAGGMAQLLTMTAPEYGLGLCGIGSLVDADIAALFDLGASHQLIYSMVGGRPAAPGSTVDMDDMEDIEI